MSASAPPTLLRAAPEVPVGDLEDALKHYSERLGFRTMSRMPDGNYAVIQRGDVALHLFSDEPGARAVSIHIFACGIDALSEELGARGATITQPVELKPWGCRDFRVTDPFGNEIKFTEPA